jgi:small GTP-binding protein
MLERSNEIKIKVILLGDGRVGKTSLAVRYTHEKFSSSYKPSLGVDFMLKRVLVEEHRVKIMVFDTAGQEFISSLRKRYYSGAHGAVIVFDVTRRETFENLDNWIKEVRDEVGQIYTTIVGNKSDLKEEREVNQEEAIEYANRLGADYMETSALSGENVKDLFQSFIDYVLDM